MTRRLPTRPPALREIRITVRGKEYVGGYQLSDGMIEVFYKEARTSTHESSGGDAGNALLARIILGELVNKNPD